MTRTRRGRRAAQGDQCRRHRIAGGSELPAAARAAAQRRRRAMWPRPQPSTASSLPRRGGRHVGHVEIRLPSHRDLGHFHALSLTVAIFWPMRAALPVLLVLVRLETPAALLAPPPFRVSQRPAVCRVARRAPSIRAQEGGGPMRDFRGLWNRLFGLEPDPTPMLELEQPAPSDEFVPLVLVVGAVRALPRVRSRPVATPATSRWPSHAAAPPPRRPGAPAGSSCGSSFSADSALPSLSAPSRRTHSLFLAARSRTPTVT